MFAGSIKRAVTLIDKVTNNPDIASSAEPQVLNGAMVQKVEVCRSLADGRCQ